MIQKIHERYCEDLRIKNLFDIIFALINDQKFKIYITFAKDQNSQKEAYDRLL